MVWVRVSDDITEHPKVAAVGGFGLALQLAGLAYCNRNLTDGFIPRNVVPGLVGWERVDAEGRLWTAGRTSGMAGDDVDNRWIAAQLVDEGLWHDEATVDDCGPCVGRWPTAQRHGYLIHDFDGYQPSKVQVLAEREGARARKQRSRDVSRRDIAVSHGPVTDAPVPVPVPQLQVQEAFDQFWAVFPRKVGKRKASAAFAAACRRAPAERILEGAKRYAIDPNRTDEFTAHPTTWLNRDGWEDAAEPPKGATGRPGRGANRHLAALADKLEER